MKRFLSFWVVLIVLFASFPPVTLALPSPNPLSDDELLELISRQSFEYFLQETNPASGLVHDRAHNFQKGAVRSASSIAATGFGLTAYGVAVERGWMDRATARELTRRTLDFFLNHAAQERGFFYHFLDPETGERENKSELSPIDTALFLAGALFAAEYFDDAEIRDLANKIYQRVDFPWMLHGGKTLALAWSPEQGFSKHRWDHYDESMILYLLAIGSPTYPIPASSWKEISRPVGSYKGYRVIQMPPLFTHQYSHIWIDFRDKNDGFADYFKNSVNAALANRAFCIDQSSKYATYGPNSWGLTASDGPFGYRAYGAPPGWAQHDGTLAPTGCGSSIVFTPNESIACLRHFFENYRDKLWGQYGFSDAFNVDRQWFDQEVIGIDQGALILMIENYRSQMIWQVMAKNTFLQEAVKKVGFVPGTKEVPWPEPPVYHAEYVAGGIQVDTFSKDWWTTETIRLNSANAEHGSFDSPEDLNGEIRIAWDREALYFFAKINDQDLIFRRSGKSIWQDDLIEVFIDPQGDGFRWNDSSDFQIGFRPVPEDGSVKTWSWFQGGEDPSDSGRVRARSFVDLQGYILEGAIRWLDIGVEPAEGKEVRVSFAIHDIDKNRVEGKLHWFFRNEDEFERFMLGRVILSRKNRQNPR